MKRSAKRLPRKFFARSPVAVAEDLIGCILWRESKEGRAAGIIVETEAYLAEDDPASHSHRGMTKRNRSMFGPPGHAYVYTIHTRYCVNVVTEAEGVGSAVLIRAIEPTEGEALMESRRGRPNRLDWARGPGRLCEALAIDRSLDGIDLVSAAEIGIVQGKPGGSVVRSRRIGISQAVERPLRFSLQGSRFVSKPPREFL